MTLYSWLYRKAQQFTHKRGWHHMETSRPMPDQGTLHWCKWCGLRVLVPDPDPMAICKAAYALSAALPSTSIRLTGIQVPTPETQQ